jgi:signal peptidase I
LGKKNQKSDEKLWSIISQWEVIFTDNSSKKWNKKNADSTLIQEVLHDKKNIEKEMTFTGEALDFLKDLVIIVLIVLSIRTFLGMPFQINGQSMYGSYYDKEFIIVDRLSYRIWSPSRWDVVVFKPHVSQMKEFFLKRIIGIWGDTVRIENGKISVKIAGSKIFEMLDEVYLNEENNGNTYVWGLRERKEYIVPNNQYFVLWDNRNHSTDSRQCFSYCWYPWSGHFIRTQDLTGKVFLDLWYFNFKAFDFIHPTLGINTTPKFLNSPKNYDY